MAVINDYVYTNMQDNVDRANPKNTGLATATIVGTFEVAAADDIGSIYRLLRMPSDAIILDVKICNDAIAGLTDVDLGFYKVSNFAATGAVADVDVLMDGVDISAGVARASATDGLSNVAIGNLGKKIYELLGKTLADREVEYDLALTAKSEPTGAGTIEYKITYAYPV